MPDREQLSTPAVDERGEPVSLGEFNGFEVYPMPVFATLAVDDPAAVAAWYEAALGFSPMFSGPLVHLRRRKYQDLLLVAAIPAPVGGSGSLTLTFNADGEVDTLAERARAVPALGVSAIEGPVDTSWNTRDLRVTDPAGNRLVFTGRNPNPDPEVQAAWQRMFDARRNR